MKPNQIIGIAGAAAAISFFLPWISMFFGSFSPSIIFQMGSEAITPSALMFVATFVLLAVVSVLSFANKKVPYMNALVMAAGALPFIISVLAIKEIHAVVGDFDEFIKGAPLGIGLYAYYLGSLIVLVFGVMNYRRPVQDEVTKKEPISASINPAE